MISLSKRQLKGVRGIIVWDFDRVLFDTEGFYRSAEMIFRKHKVPPESLWETVLQIRKEGGPFSTARALRILRDKGNIISEKKIRREIHNHLLETPYFNSAADAMLFRLRRRGFIHAILSYGASSYLRKRVKVGCGEGFVRHFVKILATRQPKYRILKKLAKRYLSLPIFFVDDTYENIEFVKKHVPKIQTLHYAKGWTLKKVEQMILASIKK